MEKQQQERRVVQRHVTRVYADDEGQLHDSDSFSPDDLLQVAYAANKAFDYTINDTDADVDKNEE